MKFYIIPIDDKYRPDLFVPPTRINRVIGNYTMEDDFYNYIINKKDILTENIEEADYYYLPIYWTKYGKKNKWFKNQNDIDYIENQIKGLNKNKIFIINSYELSYINFDVIKDFIIFSGGYLNNRKYYKIIDIPILTKNDSDVSNDKEYMYSFMGSLNTNPTRFRLYEKYKNNENFNFVIPDFRKIKNSDEENENIKNYFNNISKSYISLCPSGVYENTIRLYESMKMGVVPLIITKYDIRPFKDFIKWDEFSIYINDINDIEKLNYSKEELISMSEKGKTIYYNELDYNKWCKYVIGYFFL